MEFSDIFRLVNLAVAGLTVLGGVFQFFGLHLGTIIVSAYMIVFGLAIALLEFQTPPQVSHYAPFLFSFAGRGIFYFLLSGLILSSQVLPTLSFIIGLAVGVVGVSYVALEFIPAIEPPSNMREGDVGGWGAEQV